MLSDLLTKLGVSSPSQRKSVESTSQGTPVTSLNSTPKNKKNPKQKISKEKGLESSSASSIDYGGLPPSEGAGAVTSPINSASTNERPDLTSSNGVDKATLDDYSGLRPENSKKLLKGKSTGDNNKVSLEKKESDQSFSNETIWNFTYRTDVYQPTVTNQQIVKIMFIYCNKYCNTVLIINKIISNTSIECNSFSLIYITYLITISAVFVFESQLTLIQFQLI